MAEANRRLKSNTELIEEAARVAEEEAAVQQREQAAREEASRQRAARVRAERMAERVRTRVYVQMMLYTTRVCTCRNLTYHGLCHGTCIVSPGPAGCTYHHRKINRTSSHHIYFTTTWMGAGWRRRDVATTHGAIAFE